MSEAEVFKGTTHIGVVLDKSGSMGVVRRETIDGFNVWLLDQQQAPGAALLTLTLFDTSYSVPVVATDIAKVNPLDESRYQPSGSTALLDAVARTITEMESRGNKTEDRYLVVIVTDGQENSSREITKEKLAAMIQDREGAGNWTFTYLSAGMDAFADAAAIGIRLDNAQSYTADSVGTEAAFLSASSASRELRMSAAKASTDFYGGKRHAEGDATARKPNRPVAPKISTSAGLTTSAWTSTVSAPTVNSDSSWVKP